MFTRFSRRTLVLLVVAVVVMVAAVPAFAQSDTLSVDTGTFISAINDWLPMAMSIAAIGVGISGAFALALFVGKLILQAFQGKM